jgi:uncharacterized protein (TIGR02117 family)
MSLLRRRATRTALRSLLYIVAFFVLYIIAGFTVPYIAVNRHQPPPGPDSIALYIRSNGIHTDLVLPFRNDIKDWSAQLSYRNTMAQDSNIRYVAFGWGDKGFYLETPTWADLKASTAFKAMFFMSSSAMHVTFYPGMQTGPLCRKTSISRAHYKDLTAFIEQSFRKDGSGNFCYLAGHAYGEHDGFYDAKRVYSLFYTCNTWANQALKSGGLKACLWTPLDKGILYHYR